MVVPHEVLPGAAILDLVTAVVVSIYLGIIPKPSILASTGSTPAAFSLLDRFRGAATVVAQKTSLSDHANPQKLLFIIPAACVARCSVIFIIWMSVKVGIRAGRVGAQSEDYSGRAIGYSAVCIVSRTTR